MTEHASASIEGSASTTVSRMLGWAADHDPTLGDCEGETQPGRIGEFLEETERLSGLLGWDVAVVAAHASAQTNAFTSPAWAESLNPLPHDDRLRRSGEPVSFTSPRQAAAAHVAYLAALVEPNAEREEVGDLRAAGFPDPRLAGDAQNGERATTRPVRTLADLASPSVDAAALSEHLRGLRRDTVPDPGERNRSELPPLPEIELVESDAFFEGRGGVGPVAICYHMTWDLNLRRVLSLFRHKENDKSANFVIARDGMVYQVVHSRHTAWTNGDYKNRKLGVWNNPREDIPWLKRAVATAEQGGPNLNRYTISYELIGTPEDPAHEPQYRSAIMLSRYFCARYPAILPHRGHQIRHADINSRDRWYDPGNKFDLTRIIRELGGDPDNLTD